MNLGKKLMVGFAVSLGLLSVSDLYTTDAETVSPPPVEEVSTNKAKEPNQQWYERDKKHDAITAERLRQYRLTELEHRLEEIDEKEKRLAAEKEVQERIEAEKEAKKRLAEQKEEEERLVAENAEKKRILEASVTNEKAKKVASVVQTSSNTETSSNANQAGSSMKESSYTEASNTETGSNETTKASVETDLSGFSFHGQSFPLSSFSGTGQVPYDTPYIFQWNNRPSHYLIERVSPAGDAINSVKAGDKVTVEGKTYTVHHIERSVENDSKAIGMLDKHPSTITFQTCELGKGANGLSLLAIWYAS